MEYAILKKKVTIQRKRWLTQRALDGRDSLPFSSIFPWASTRTGWLRVYTAPKQNPCHPTTTNASRWALTSNLHPQGMTISRQT